MARPLYSTVVLNGLLTGVQTDTLDIIEGIVIVVRDISYTVSDSTSAADATALEMTMNLTQSWGLVFPPGTNATDHEEGRWVAPGPSVLSFAQVTSTSARVQYQLSGYLLTAP